MRNGSLPISFHRRLLTGRGPDRACRSSRPSTSRPAARGSSSGPAPRPASAPRPTGPSGSPSGSWRMGARLIHLVDFDGARRGAPANLEVVGAIASRVAVPLQVAGGVDTADAIRLAFAAGATRVVLTTADRRPPRRPAGLPRGRRRLAGGRARPAAGAAGRLPVAPAGAADRRCARRRARRRRRRPLRPDPRRRRAGPRARRTRARSVVRCRDPGGRRGPRPRRHPPPARYRRRRRHPRGGPALRGHRLSRSLEAAA